MKIMTYNILNGGAGREQLILSVIQSIQPDIVILQEVYTPKFLQDLADALEMEPFFANGNQKRRVALLSHLPIRSVKSHHPILPIWRNVVASEIEYQPGQYLHLFGIHPKADLGIISEGWRWLEARQILSYVSAYENKPCLIAGDFNAIAPGDSIRMEMLPWWLKLKIRLQGNRAYHFSIQAYMAAGFTDCFRYLNQDEAGYTLPPPDPNSRLDYIFVNSALKLFLKRSWVVRQPSVVEDASDHYPVVAEFDF